MYSSALPLTGSHNRPGTTTHIVGDPTSESRSAAESQTTGSAPERRRTPPTLPAFDRLIGRQMSEAT